MRRYGARRAALAATRDEWVCQESAAYGHATGASSHDTGRPDVLLHRAAVVTAIIATLLSDGQASLVARKLGARTQR